MQTSLPLVKLHGNQSIWFEFVRKFGLNTETTTTLCRPTAFTHDCLMAKKKNPNANKQKVSLDCWRHTHIHITKNVKVRHWFLFHGAKLPLPRIKIFSVFTDLR